MRPPQNIGFVSTRFAGIDGVSLESAKWAEILGRHQHRSFWYAGRLDRDPEVSLLAPEAFFGHPRNLEIDAKAFGRMKRDAELTRRIFALAEELKASLYEFVRRFSIDILVAENVLCLPMHIPLGVALTHLIAETQFPVIAHHHDFYWERDRFAVNAVNDFLQMAFPPALASIQHVTINSFAQSELAHRKGCASTLIPNVLDFDTPPEPPDEYAADFRQSIGLAAQDILVLQPTRVVPRKGIEQAIQLLARLGDGRYKLVVTHESGDEGPEYHDQLVHTAESAGVDLRFVTARVGDTRGVDAQGNKRYSLEDVYPHADLVTYFSTYEGFGNALLEAFYFRKPVVLNRYVIYVGDIETKGFDVIAAADGVITGRVVERVRQVLEDDAHRDALVNHNYELARLFFGYSVARRKLRALVSNITGHEDL